MAECLPKANQGVVNDLLKDGGLGGVIALDNEGKGTLKACFLL